MKRAGEIVDYLYAEPHCGMTPGPIIAGERAGRKGSAHFEHVQAKIDGRIMRAPAQVALSVLFFCAISKSRYSNYLILHIQTTGGEGPSVRPVEETVWAMDGR